MPSKGLSHAYFIFRRTIRQRVRLCNPRRTVQIDRVSNEKQRAPRRNTCCLNVLCRQSRLHQHSVNIGDVSEFLDEVAERFAAHGRPSRRDQARHPAISQLPRKSEIRPKPSTCEWSKFSALGRLRPLLLNLPRRPLWIISGCPVFARMRPLFDQERTNRVRIAGAGG